jgi:hypothetical protein
MSASTLSGILGVPRMVFLYPLFWVCPLVSLVCNRTLSFSAPLVCELQKVVDQGLSGVCCLQSFSVQVSS